MQPICGWKLRLMAAWQNTTQLRTPSHTWTVSLPRQEPLQVAFWFPGSFRQSSRSSAAIHAPLSCLSPASPLGKKLSTQGQVRERSGYFFLPRSSAARLTSTVSRLLGFLQGPQDQTIRQIQEGQDSETFKLNRILNVFFPICSSIRQLYLYNGHVRDGSIFETIWQLPGEKEPSGKDVPRGESHVQWFQIGADSWEMLGHAQWWPKRWKILCFHRKGVRGSKDRPRKNKNYEMKR